MMGGPDDNLRPPWKWKHYPGFIQLFIVLVILLLFSFIPSAANLLYREIGYPAYRMLWDYSIGLLPFPLVYIVLPCALLGLIQALRRERKKGQRYLLAILQKLAGWTALFFWVWGFNYSCSNINNTSPTAITGEELLALGKSVAQQAAEERSRLTNPYSLPPANPGYISSLIEQQLIARGRSIWGDPEFHFLPDDGWIRKLGIGGMYFPYSGEGYSSDTYNGLTGTFIAAHELAHAFGVTHEGEADYIAWYALKSDTSRHSALRYAADLSLLRSIRLLLRTNDPVRWEELIRSTAHPVNMDILLMRTESAKFTEWIPGMGEKVNDGYLRLVGQQNGVASYDEFVEMIWKDRVYSDTAEADKSVR